MYLKIKLLSYLREISGGKSNIVLKFEEDTIKLRAVLSELQRIFGNKVKKLLINEIDLLPPMNWGGFFGHR